MKAVDAIVKVFQETQWDMEQVKDAKYPTYVVVLDKFSVEFTALDDIVYISSKMFSIAKIDSNVIETLKKACAMVMQVWKDHPINVCIKDGKLVLEATANLDKDDIILVTENFLDDCDFFYENITAPNNIYPQSVLYSGIMP